MSGESLSYPTFTVADTARLLRESVAAVEWGMDAISQAWTHELPSFYPTDSWTVARNVAHMIVYEEKIGIPVLAALADGGDGVGSTFSMLEDWLVQDAIVLSAEPISALRPRLRSARERTVALVESFSEERLNVRVTPLWATTIHGTPPHSPGWVASKTMQHTWEHGTRSCVLRSLRRSNLRVSLGLAHRLRRRWTTSSPGKRCHRSCFAGWLAYSCANVARLAAATDNRRCRFTHTKERSPQ